MAMRTSLNRVPASAIRAGEQTMSSGFTLASSHRGKRLTLTANMSVPLPNPAAVGSGYEVDLLTAPNVSVSMPTPAGDTWHMSGGQWLHLAVVGGAWQATRRGLTYEDPIA